MEYQANKPVSNLSKQPFRLKTSTCTYRKSSTVTVKTKNGCCRGIVELMGLLAFAAQGAQSLVVKTVDPAQCFSLRSACEARIDIKETSSMGLGAFSTTPIGVGTFLGEYAGELITEYEVQTRYRGKHDMLECDRQWVVSRDERSQTKSGDYLFDMGHGILIDAEDTDMSSWCRYMNHAETGTNQCNVRPFNRETNDAGLHKPRFFTIRDIEVGEELKYDYGDVYYKRGTEPWI